MRTEKQTMVNRVPEEAKCKNCKYWEEWGEDHYDRKHYLPISKRKLPLGRCDAPNTDHFFEVNDDPMIVVTNPDATCIKNPYWLVDVKTLLKEIMVMFEPGKEYLIEMVKEENPNIL